MKLPFLALFVILNSSNFFHLCLKKLKISFFCLNSLFVSLDDLVDCIHKLCMNLNSFLFYSTCFMNSLAVIESAFVKAADLAQCSKLYKYLLL